LLKAGFGFSSQSFSAVSSPARSFNARRSLTVSMTGRSIFFGSFDAFSHDARVRSEQSAIVAKSLREMPRSFRHFMRAGPLVMTCLTFLPPVGDVYFLTVGGAEETRFIGGEVTIPRTFDTLFFVLAVVLIGILKLTVEDMQESSIKTCNFAGLRTGQLNLLFDGEMTTNLQVLREYDEIGAIFPSCAGNKNAVRPYVSDSPTPRLSDRLVSRAVDSTPITIDDLLLCNS